MELCEFSSYALHDDIRIWQRSSAPAYQGKDIQDALYGTVLAKDHNHAIKIFNEKRVQLIASGEFKPTEE